MSSTVRPSTGAGVANDCSVLEVPQVTPLPGVADAVGTGDADAAATATAKATPSKLNTG
jgi:hypothetical protein